jgi:hypothetical protein
MTERITRERLESALTAHVATLTRYGLFDPDTGRIVLDIGSKTYGRAYRLAFIANGETGHRRPPVGSDYLGMTAREAHAEIVGRTSLLHDVFYVLGQQEPEGWTEPAGDPHAVTNFEEVDA